MKLKDTTKALRIKNVTRDIVYERGLVGVKMSEVAKRAKLSPSNLYIYFSNKEVLLNTIYFDVIDVLSQQAIQRIHDEIPYKTKLFFLYKDLIIKKIKNVKKFYFLQQFEKSPYFNVENHQKLDKKVKEIIAFFLYGQEQLILKDTVEVDLLLAFVDGTTDGLIDFHQKSRIKLDDAMIQKSFNLLWDAIRQ